MKTINLPTNDNRLTEFGLQLNDLINANKGLQTIQIVAMLELAKFNLLLNAINEETNK